VETGTLKEGERVFFEDEMKIGLYPRMFREWSIPGMRHEVEAVCALEGKKNLFGSVDISTGELTLLVKDRCRTIDFIEHCEQLLKKYPLDKLYLVCDNSIIHCSKKFKEYAKEQERLEIVYLPTYAFYLNVIELLWLFVRKAVCYNNQFCRLKWLVEEVLNFLNKLSPKRVLKAIGINLGAT
jgi:transposase